MSGRQILVDSVAEMEQKESIIEFNSHLFFVIDSWLAVRLVGRVHTMVEVNEFPSSLSLFPLMAQIRPLHQFQRLGHKALSYKYM